MRDLALSYDSACRPSLTFKDTLWQGCLALKTDSGWDTNVVFIPSGNTMWFMFTRPAWHGHGDCAFLEADWWSMGGLIDGYGVGLFVRDSGVWTSYAMVLGLDGGGSGFAALVDSSDSIHTFWAAYDPYGTNKLVCDGAWTDYFASVASACLDNLDRMQCVWVRGDTLKYVLPHEPPLIIRIVDGIVWCDITTDTLSEPVIAFCRNDGSIWVAHGIGIVGLSEEREGRQFGASRGRSQSSRAFCTFHQRWALSVRRQAFCSTSVDGRC
jgi:hypothetical protein